MVDASYILLIFKLYKLYFPVDNEQFDTSIIIYLTQKVDLIDINISWKCIFLESSVRYLSKEMKHISRYLKGEKHVKRLTFLLFTGSNSLQFSFKFTILKWPETQRFCLSKRVRDFHLRFSFILIKVYIFV